MNIINSQTLKLTCYGVNQQSASTSKKELFDIQSKSCYQIRYQYNLHINIIMQVIKEQLEVVWAKVKGYSWWPATVSILQRQSCEKIRVEFFGESSHSYVTNKMIVDFRKHFQEFANTRNKKLLRSIRLAEEFEELIRTKDLVDKETMTTVNEPRNQLQIPKEQQEEHLKSIQPPSAIVMEEQKSLIADSNMVIQQPQSIKHNPISTSAKKYKKIQKIRPKDFDRIPYRKFQDLKFECKIVDLLNKLKTNKNCEGELEKLLFRIPKINGKAQFNRFIVSGIAVVIRLLRKRKQINHSKQIFLQIQEAYKQLLSKIKQEIHDSDNIKNQILENQFCGDPNLLSPVEKKGLVKSLYKLLREKQIQGREHCQDISIKLCEQLERQRTSDRSNATKLLFKKISSEECQPQQLLRQICLLSN